MTLDGQIGENGSTKFDKGSFSIESKIGLSNLISNWCVNKRSSYSYGIDQDFLREIIYPLIKDKSIQHCDFNLNFGEKLIPFPTNRNNYEFVGDVFDENEQRHPDYWKIIKNVIG